MSTIRYPNSLTFRPLATLSPVVVSVPGSKSITNRALLIAALAHGSSRLVGALDADDTRVMIEALRELGAQISWVSDDILTVDGVAGRFNAPSRNIFIGNSGTTIRFLTASAALAPAGSTVVLDGVARMRQRPIQDLLDALSQLAVNAESVNGDGCPPVRVAGGGIAGGVCAVRGSISSQYLSGLLMAAPLADDDVTIRVTGELVSKPYVELTRDVMQAFGASSSNISFATLSIPSRQRYDGRVYQVEPDASNATYFLAAAAATGSRVRIEGLGSASRQGDATFVDVLSKMGCRVERTTNSTDVIGPSELHGIDIDLEAIPDTAQTVAALAVLADSRSRITGLRTLRVKETDRIAAMACEMRKLGATVDEDDDSWTINPPVHLATGAVVNTYDDHRMAMSLAVVGLRAGNLTINEPACVAKTFPDFWVRWERAFQNVEPKPEPE